MNANLKSPNNTAYKVLNNSFITAPINNVKNTANNMATSIKNAFSNVVPSDISKPINDSITATNNQTPMPNISVPVIIALGMLIVLFILVVIFREKLANGLEILWEKLKEFLGFTKPSVQPPPPEFVPEAAFFNQGAI